MNTPSRTEKLRIGVLGGTGMLGSDLVKFLGEKYETTAITRDNYDGFRDNAFDVLVNANGNSLRFWANGHPYEDFAASTVSVAKSLFDFRYKKYIYISSPDVYEEHSRPEGTLEDSPGSTDALSPYGFHKRLSEELVKHYAGDFVVLRSAAILGSNLKKGIVYDILCGNELFVTPDSSVQFVTTQALAEVIDVLLAHNIGRETFNVGGRGTVTPEHIATIADKTVRVHKDAEKQMYELNIGKIAALYQELKTSEEYVRQLAKELRKR